MIKSIAIVFVAVMAAMNAQAQKIQVVDSEGNGIPLVSVLTEDGLIIGATDLGGTLADAKGAKKVTLTHIAYKPQTVNVASLTDGRVTMEHVDYEVEDVVVKPKPYLYKEYYFRAFSFIGDSLRAYGAGIVPVAYDIKKNYGVKIRTLQSYGIFANKAVMWHGVVIKQQIENGIKNSDHRSTEKWLKAGKVQKEYRTTLVSDGPNRWRVEIPTKEVVGQIVHSGNFNRSTLDGARMQMYSDSIRNRDKMLKNKQKRNYQYQYTSIYTMDDEEETPDLIRHVMEMNHWEFDSSKGRQKLIYYLYTVDHGFVDEKEFKARSKELNRGVCRRHAAL